MENNSIIINRPATASHSEREAFKAFRTNLLFCGKDKKIIAMTSCMPNDGKTTLSLLMAFSLADAGKKVLLVDGDIRNSAMLARYAEGSCESGLSHLLSGQATQEEVVMKTQEANFDIVFAGYRPPNPVELLGNEKFGEFLASVRDDYDYILIDTPPVGIVIDAAVIAKVCDGIVMVIAADRVSRRFAADCCAQLNRSGCPIIGAVLNMIPDNSNAHYGRYHYGRYHYGKYHYGRYYYGYGYGYGGNKKKDKKQEKK